MKRISDNSDTESLPDSLPDFDSGNETPCVRCCIRLSGAVCCCIIVSWAIALAFALWPVGTTTMPVWARSWLFLSTGHQLDVYTGSQRPPPPPSFQNG